jgi:dTDP-4-dehydrorhamnose reductase
VRPLLIPGAGGQLGTDLRTLAQAQGIPFSGYTSGELDISDEGAVSETVGRFARQHPDGVIVNAAAYTAVDKAESDVDRAFKVNGEGPVFLARAAAAHGLGLIHVSTDYVFPGDAFEPYEPTDPTGPKSVYGASKLAGESGALQEHPDTHVVRTAWVYGATGGNFVKTMCALERKHPTVSVVDDQQGSPTYSRDLAAGLIELANADVPGGVLHATNTGATTWFGFTRAIFAEIGADPERVLPTTTDAFPRPAPRPAYSVLSPRAWVAAGLTELRSWQDALADALRSDPGAFRPAPAE